MARSVLGIKERGQDCAINLVDTANDFVAADEHDRAFRKVASQHKRINQNTQHDILTMV